MKSELRGPSFITKFSLLNSWFFSRQSSSFTRAKSIRKYLIFLSFLFLMACSVDVLEQEETTPSVDLTDQNTIPGGTDTATVDKSSGKAQQILVLAALSTPSSPDFSIPINYTSNTYLQTFDSNKILAAPDAGLGWSNYALNKQVIRLNQGTGTFEDDQYLLYFGTDQYTLTYQCAYGSDDCSTLHPNDYEATTDAAGNSYDIYYYVTNQADFSVIKHIVNTKDAGQTYSTWKMTTASGVTYLFGGSNYTNTDSLRPAEADISDRTVCTLLVNDSTVNTGSVSFSGSLQSGCQPGSVKVGVMWGNWIGPNDFSTYTNPLDTSESSTQSQFGTAWNLSVIENSMGQQTNLYWAHNTQNVGLNGATSQDNIETDIQSFTRDSYLYKVEADNGDRLVLNYCPRVGNANVVAGNATTAEIPYDCESPSALPTEFYDPHMENQEPDGFQEPVRTLYLKSVDTVLNRTGDTASDDTDYVNNRTELSYAKMTLGTSEQRILTEVNYYLGQPQNDGTFSLTKSSPPTLYCYLNYTGGSCADASGDTYTEGLLSSVTTPDGAVTEYGYEAVQFSNDDVPIEVQGETGLEKKTPIYGAGFMLIQGNRDNYFDLDLYDMTPTGWKVHKSIFSSLKLTAADDSYFVSQNIAILPNGFLVNTPDQKLYWVKRVLGTTSTWEEPVQLASDLTVASFGVGQGFVGVLGDDASYMIYNSYDNWQTFEALPLSGSNNGESTLPSITTSAPATLSYVSASSNYLAFWRAGTTNKNHTVAMDFFYKTEAGTWSGDAAAPMHLEKTDAAFCVEAYANVGTECESISISTSDDIPEAPYITSALIGPSVGINLPIEMKYVRVVKDTSCDSEGCGWDDPSYNYLANAYVYSIDIPIDFDLSKQELYRVAPEIPTSENLTIKVQLGTGSDPDTGTCYGNDVKGEGTLDTALYGYSGSALLTNNGYYSAGYRQSYVEYEEYKESSGTDCNANKDEYLYTTSESDVTLDYAVCAFNTLSGTAQSIKDSTACQGSISALNDSMVAVTANNAYAYYGLDPREQTMTEIYSPSGSASAESTYTLVETNSGWGIAAEVLSDVVQVGMMAGMAFMDPEAMGMQMAFMVGSEGVGAGVQAMASAVGYHYKVHWSQPHLASMGSGNGWFYQGDEVYTSNDSGTISSVQPLLPPSGGTLQTEYFGSLFGYIPFVVLSSDGSTQTVYVQRLMNIDPSSDGLADEWAEETITVRQDAATSTNLYTTGQYNPVVETDGSTGNPVQYKTGRGDWDRYVNLSGPGAFLAYEYKDSAATSFYNLADSGEFSIYRVWEEFDPKGYVDVVVNQVTLTDGISQSSSTVSYVYDTTKAGYSSALQSGVYGQVAIFPGETASSVSAISDAGTYGKTVVQNYYGNGDAEDPLLLGMGYQSASYKADTTEYASSENQYNVRQYSYSLVPEDGTDTTYSAPIRAVQLSSTTSILDGIPSIATYSYTDYNLPKRSTQSALKYNPLDSSTTWKSTASVTNYAWENSTYQDWVLGKNRLSTAYQSSSTYQEMSGSSEAIAENEKYAFRWEDAALSTQPLATAHNTGISANVYFTVPSLQYESATGTLHLAYSDLTNNQINYTTSTDDGQTWATSVVAVTGITGDTSGIIAVKNTGDNSVNLDGIYIAYVGSGNKIGLSYSSDGVTWEDKVSTSTKAETTSYNFASIAFGPTGELFMTFRGTNADVYAGKYDLKTSGNWSYAAVSGAQTAATPAIAVDSQGYISIVYQGYQNSNLYAIRSTSVSSTSSWTTAYQFSGANTESFPNLSVGADDNFYIYYIDGSTGSSFDGSTGHLSEIHYDPATNTVSFMEETVSSLGKGVQGVSNTFNLVGKSASSSAVTSSYMAYINSDGGSSSQFKIEIVAGGQIEFTQGTNSNGCMTGREDSDPTVINKLVTNTVDYYCNGASNAVWATTSTDSVTLLSSSLSDTIDTSAGTLNITAKPASGDQYFTDVNVYSLAPDNAQSLCWAFEDAGIELITCDGVQPPVNFMFLDYTLSASFEGSSVTTTMSLTQLAYYDYANNNEWQCLAYAEGSYLWQDCGYVITGSSDDQNLQIPLSFNPVKMTSIKDELTTAQTSTTFEWCKVASENGGTNTCQSTAPSTDELADWVMLSQVQQVSRAEYTNPTSETEITVLTVTERDPTLLIPIETEDTFGVASSIIYSNDQRLSPISSFKNASVSNGEAGYYGFETYEDDSDYTVANGALESADPHSGIYAYGDGSKSVTLTYKTANPPSDGSATVASVWVQPITNETCSLSLDGSTVTSSEGDFTWEHLEITGVISAKSTLEVTCSKGGYFDDFRFAPVGSGFEAFVYASSDSKGTAISNPYWQVQSRLNGNGGMTTSYYDQWYRSYASTYNPISGTNRMGPMVLPGFSRLSGYGTYQSSYLQNAFDDNNPNSMASISFRDSTAGMLNHESTTGFTTTLAKPDFALRGTYHTDNALTDSEISGSLLTWNGMTLTYNSGGNQQYNLSDQCWSDQDQPFFTDWVFVGYEGGFFLFGDGKNVLSCSNLDNAQSDASSLTLSSPISGDEWTDVFVGYQPTLSLAYGDGYQRAVQLHKLTVGADIGMDGKAIDSDQAFVNLATGMIYDNWGHPAVSGMPAMVGSTGTDTSERSDSRLTYFPNLMAFEWSNNQLATSSDVYNFYKDTNSDDAPYAFSQSQYESSPAGRVTDTTAASGQQFSLANTATTNYQTEVEYQNADEQSLASDLKLTDYEDYLHFGTSMQAFSSAAEQYNQTVRGQDNTTFYRRTVVDSTSQNNALLNVDIQFGHQDDWQSQYDDNNPYIHQGVTLLPNYFDNSVSSNTNFLNQTQQRDTLGQEVASISPDISGMTMVIRDNKGRVRFAGHLDSEADGAGVLVMAENFAYWKYDNYGRIMEAGTLVNDSGSSNYKTDAYTLANTTDFPSSTERCLKSEYTYDYDNSLDLSALDSDLEAEVQRNWRGRLIQIDNQMSNIPENPSSSSNCSEGSDKGSAQVRNYYNDFSENMGVSENQYDSSGKTSNARNTGYSYDNQGVILSVTYPDADRTADVTSNTTVNFDLKNQTTIDYLTDDFSRLTSVCDDASSATNGDLSCGGNQYVTDISYTFDGLVALRTLGNGVTEGYSYDFIRNLSQIQSLDSSETNLFTEQLSYGITSDDDLPDQCQDQAYDRGMIVARQVSSDVDSLSDLATTECYTYNGAARLTQVVGESDTTTFSHDSNGNALSESHSKQTSEDATYTYKAGTNQTDTISTFSGSPPLSYNDQGSVMSMPVNVNGSDLTNTFTRDYQSQKVMSVANEICTVNYSYDGMGRRAVKDLSQGTASNIACDSEGDSLASVYGRNAMGKPLLRSNTETGDTSLYLYTSISLSADVVVDGNNGDLYVLKDHRDNVVEVLDDTGTWVGGISYSTGHWGAFTDILNTGNSNATKAMDLVPYRFDGHPYDADFDLYDYGFRFYYKGLFLSRDAFGDSISPYVAFGNNPVNYVDVHGGVKIVPPKALTRGFGFSREHTPYRPIKLNEVLKPYSKARASMLMISEAKAKQNGWKSILKDNPEMDLRHGAVIERFQKETNVTTYRQLNIPEENAGWGSRIHINPTDKNAPWPKMVKDVFEVSAVENIPASFNLAYQNMEVIHNILKNHAELLEKFQSGVMSSEDFYQAHLKIGITNLEIATSLLGKEVPHQYYGRESNIEFTSQHWGHRPGKGGAFALNEDEMERMGMVPHSKQEDGYAPINNENYIESLKDYGKTRIVPPERSLNSVNHLAPINENVEFPEMRASKWIMNEDGFE